MNTQNETPKDRLRHHVSGAIERGEAQAIAGIPATQNETPAHTPLPWHYEKANYEGPSWRANIVRIEKGTSAIYARAYGATIDEADANSALIVRAVNSHAELVEALETAVARFDFTVAAMAKGQTVSISSLQNCAADARMALAKAKGEGQP